MTDHTNSDQNIESHFYIMHSRTGTLFYTTNEKHPAACHHLHPTQKQNPDNFPSTL